MKKTVLLLTQAFILLMLVVCIAFAGGYQLNEMGARAVGMGGAFVARASDPSAIYFNPAGLAFQKGINVLGGLDLIIPSTDFTPTGSSTKISTESQVFVPINLYGTYQINDDIVVGLGIFNPFGLGTKWPSALASLNTSLQTWYFNPSVGYKINDQISVGLGISYVYASVKQTADPSTSLDGTGSGFNINFGGIYKPSDVLSIGLSYRIETDIDLSGDFASQLGKTTGKATMPMPGNLLFGAAFEVMPELTVEADLQFVQWSAYKGLSVTFSPALTYYGHAISEISDVTPWDNAWTLRGGAEYKLDPQITLRGGLILDLSPQPPHFTEPMLPDGDRFDISVGGSYKINDNLYVDASYMLVLFMQRDAKNATPSGIYNSTAHVLCVDVGYTF